jgi:hypothetical protein
MFEPECQEKLIAAPAHPAADLTNATAALNALRSCRSGLIKLPLDANTAAYELHGGRLIAERAQDYGR